MNKRLTMKQLFTLTLLLLCAFYSTAQSVFNIDVVHKVEITFFDDNWDHLLDSLASEGTGTGSGTGRILAHVIINGTEFDSCGVRYKGNSSMDIASDKNPFNIDLNHIISGQEYQGKDKIKLANCYTDPSMVREALTYELSNLYMDAPRASFVELYINEEYRGIYTNTESVDNEFLNKHYGSSNNPFFKCDPVTFDLFGDNSNLAYHPDSMDYVDLYDMKSDFGYGALQDLTYELELEPETVGDYLDVDRALWFLAVSSAYVHNDGYTAFGHNFYVYQMSNGKWSIVIWDVNMSFGGLVFNGTGFLPLGFDALAEQDPFLHDDAIDFRPLIAALLSNPKYRRMYVAHLRTITEETISNNHYLDRAETMHELISPYVETEPYSHYSFDDFNSNVYDNVGFWFDFRPGLEALMDAREPYLTGLPEFGYTQPTINPIVVSPADPAPYEVATFTTEVMDASIVEFNYRYNEFDYFLTQTMFDDGAHGDGGAGDGVYGIEIPILATDLDYYIYAENSEAGKFSPVRAAYEYYTLVPSKGLVINELAANNGNIAPDEDGEFDDWIELYNNSDETIALAGYHLSDDADDMAKWTFPDVSIASGEYLILWADRDTVDATDLHTNFRLSAAGEVLSLSDADGQLLDQVDYPEQYEDITYGRYENGTGTFNYLYPTFNAENTTLIGLEEEKEEAIEIAVLSAYPNPAQNQVTVNYSSEQTTILRMYSVTGRLMLEQKITDQTTVQLDISNFVPGLYIITDTEGRIFKLLVN
ncbi:MAG: T9SS type A sorting domain-containing protein [Crocinitomix sp.]|nr:T9SS type A sorting domain-containing protein [Crocinitomix sp.]